MFIAVSSFRAEIVRLLVLLSFPFIEQQYTCVCFYLPDHRRSALSFFTMGSSCSNHLGIPPGNGPNAVGCTDFMMDHTAEVQAKENLCSC